MPLDRWDEPFYFIFLLLVWCVPLPFMLPFFVRKLLPSFLRKNCFKRGRWEHLQSEIWKLPLQGISVPLSPSEYYTFKKACFTLKTEAITFNCGSQHEKLSKKHVFSSPHSQTCILKNRNTPIHTKKQARVVLGIYLAALLSTAA